MGMKALRKTADGVGHVELCEVPVPDVGPDEVVMKVYAAGICGSDLLIQEDRHYYRAPVTQGHEFAGIAYKLGAGRPRVFHSHPTSHLGRTKGRRRLEFSLGHPD